MAPLRVLIACALLSLGCQDELGLRTEEAAVRVRSTREAAARAAAQADFEQLRALRVASLRAEHSVAATQPVLVEVIANARPLPPVVHARLAETLAIFRQRLAHARVLIEQLATTSADDWEQRDDEVGRVMAEVFIARDASWQALDPHHRDVAFPEA